MIKTSQIPRFFLAKLRTCPCLKMTHYWHNCGIFVKFETIKKITNFLCLCASNRTFQIFKFFVIFLFIFTALNEFLSVFSNIFFLFVVIWFLNFQKRRRKKEKNRFLGNCGKTWQLAVLPIFLLQFFEFLIFCQFWCTCWKSCYKMIRCFFFVWLWYEVFQLLRGLFCLFLEMVEGFVTGCWKSWGKIY
jgi:hypothetical protein